MSELQPFIPSRDDIRARKMRLGQIVAEVIPPPPLPSPPPDPIKDQLYWPSMWMGDLVYGQFSSGRPPKVDDIIRLVCDEFHISVDEIKSASRCLCFVRPRQIVMYLSRLLTIRSLPEIGKRLGGRDHTTVLHGCRKVSLLMDRSEEFAQQVYRLARTARAQA